MEGGVEDCHLGDLRKDFLHGPDTREVCGVVQRSEGAALVDGLHDFIVDDYRGGKVFAPVNHPVPHRSKLFQTLQNAVLLGEKSFENELHRHLVVGDIPFFGYLIPLGGAVLQQRSFDADTLHQPLAED